MRTPRKRERGRRNMAEPAEHEIKFVQAVYFTPESRIGTLYDCYIQARGPFLAIWREGLEGRPDYYNTAVIEWIKGVDEPPAGCPW